MTGRPPDPPPWPATVTHLVAMPDSLLSPLLRAVPRDGIGYVQTVHEAQAVGLAAGLALGGARPLLCMENSGLRAAAESVARLVVLHGIPLAFLLAGRGGAADRNWWAAHHMGDADQLIAMFRLRRLVATEPDELGPSIGAAVDLAYRRIAPAAVIAMPAALTRWSDAQP